MEKYMKTAIDEAKKGIELGHGGPFGATIVKDGTIVSCAHNTVIRDKNPLNHAEINAIKDALEKLGSADLSDCDIYATSMPCPMCFGAIKWSRIKNIYYGTSYNDVEKIGFDDMRFFEQIKECKGTAVLERQECLELLDSWDKSPLKKLY